MHNHQVDHFSERASGNPSPVLPKKDRNTHNFVHQDFIKPFLDPKVFRG